MNEYSKVMNLIISLKCEKMHRFSNQHRTKRVVVIHSNLFSLRKLS